VNDPAYPPSIEPPPFAEGVEELPEGEDADEVISELIRIEEIQSAAGPK